jgi:hypothetical protein
MSIPTTAQATLTAAHLAHLRTSAISDEIIAERGYLSIHPGAVNDVRGLPGSAHGVAILKRALHQGAIAFPAYRCGADVPTTWVLRPDLPRTDKRGKAIKYEWPASVTNILDILPRYREALTDPSIPIWLTEGAKKADALATAFGAAILPINLNGVYGWRGTNAQGGKTAIPDLHELALNGREIVLAFDSDMKTNKNVRGALMELARLLTARGTAAVRFVALPDGADGAKVGVDDFLAGGGTTDQLIGMLANLSIVQQVARVPLCAHPETGQPLYLPHGYDVVNQQIVKAGPRGDLTTIYPGAIYVRSLGIDIGSGDEAATLQWAGASHGMLAMSRADMANARNLRDRLAARGALIHDGNAKALTAYLVEFVAQNCDDLPRVSVTSRLGVHGDALVLPDRSIGGDGPIMFQSVRPLLCGSDGDAYPAALREMATWDDFGSIPSIILAMAFAAPMIARIRPRRNPAIYLAGPSSSGKTTLIQFAVGAWGDPTLTPFRVEATRTSTAGYLQTLADLGGLPLFVDEAHTAQFPDRLETLVYNFANGQSYTKGTVTGHAAGGELLSGALLLAGEARAEFQNSGSRNRSIWLDGHRWSPMGTSDPEQGAAHARMLESAWDVGAGRFGATLAEAIWREWDAFIDSSEVIRAMPETLSAPPAWQHIFAIGMATLVAAFEIVGVVITPADQAAIMGQWCALLSSGNVDSDPAADAWEQLVLLITGAARDTTEGWEIRTWNREPVAYQRINEGVWRVPTRSALVRERVGASAVQLYGATWAARGWIEKASDGSCSHVNKVGTEGSARVIRIPTEALSTWRVTTEVTPSPKV